MIDDRGLPSFALLQKRGRLTRRADVARAAVELPASLYVFDLLVFRRSRSARVAAHRAQGRAAWSAADGGRAALLRAHRDGRRGDVRRSRAHGPRGHRRQARRLAVCDEALDRLGQGQRGEVRRLRRRGLLAASATVRGGFQRAAACAVSRRRAHVCRSRRQWLRAARFQGDRAAARRSSIGGSARGRQAPNAATCGSRLDRSCRSSSSSARPTGCCASPCTCACATTSARKSACGPARRPPATNPWPTRRRPEAVRKRSHRQVSFTNLDKVFWPADGYTKGDLIRLLRRHRRVVVALSQGPARRAHALSGRHRRQVVLPEGCSGVRAGLVASRDDVERTRRSARSATSFSTTCRRSCMSRTWARFRCTCGRAG